jgi:sugar lactone lactonase YvrE
VVVAALAGVTTFAQSGQISTEVGTGAGGFSGDQGPAALAQINTPRGIAFDAAGNLYLADSANHRIRRVDAVSGVITTVAGIGAPGFNGDGIVATSARLNFPRGIGVDASGHLLIADSRNHRIRRVDAETGIITTVAGTGTSGSLNDGGSASAAQIAEPAGLLVASGGDILFTELAGGRIRRVDAASGLISTVVGGLSSPFGVVADAAGNLFMADTGNARVLRRDAISGSTSTVAGTGEFGYNGDDIPAVGAQLIAPAGLAIDSGGHLFIADMVGQRVRRVDAVTGLITTVAGTGVPGFNGDGQAAQAAQLRAPDPLAVDADGNLFIGEAGGARIRRVEGAGASSNAAPTANAVLTFAGPVCGASGGTLVQLNGAGSFDPDAGDVLTYTWTGPFPEGTGTVTGIAPVVTLPLGGPHVVSLTVSDPGGAEHSTTASIAISDTASPELTVTNAAVSVPPFTGLWRPVDILAVTGTSAVDACDPNPAITVDGPSSFRRGSTTVVTIVASDASGNAVSRAVEVTVEQGGKPEDVDGANRKNKRN